MTCYWTSLFRPHAERVSIRFPFTERTNLRWPYVEKARLFSEKEGICRKMDFSTCQWEYISRLLHPFLLVKMWDFYDKLSAPVYFSSVSRRLEELALNVMASHFGEIFLCLELYAHEFISRHTLFNLTTVCSVVKSISQIASKSHGMFILPTSRTVIFAPSFRLWRGTILVPRALEINTLSQTKHYSPMTHSGY